MNENERNELLNRMRMASADENLRFDWSATRTSKIHPHCNVSPLDEFTGVGEHEMITIVVGIEIPLAKWVETKLND